MIETYPSQSCDIKQKVEIIYNMNGALILIQKVKRGKKITRGQIRYFSKQEFLSVELFFLP